MDDTVYEWCDAVYERYPRPLLKITPLTGLYAQTSHCQFVLPLFQKIIQLVTLTLFLIQMIKQPKGEQQQYDGNTHSNKHPVKLFCRTLQLTCTCLELSVLTGLCHQVYVDVSVYITLFLIVHCRIGHTQLFPDTRHKVWCLIDDRVRQCLLQIIER